MSRASSHTDHQLDNIGRLLLRAQRDFDAELNARLRERGYPDVRLAHSALFAHIDPEGTRSSELAERAGMTKQGMGQLVADLEEKGYVVRVEDPADRRAKLVRLTKKGWQHIRDAREIIGKIEEAYAQRLGDGRLETLRAILKDLPPR
jgi:MarR family transcriptional regulator, temperature-dependent positive regulator of motility